MADGLNLKLIVGVSLVIAFFILLSLAQEVNRKWQIQTQVATLEEEARTLEHRVIELENLNQYFRSADYQERLAREKLNYRAEGEFVVLLPEETEKEVSSESITVIPEPKEITSIPLKWWYVFFVNNIPIN